MKKIVISLCVISAIAVVAVGVTSSYFFDTETSTNNIIQTGTVDIDIDGQNHWTGKFDWGNAKPGDTREITFVIHNVGTYPIKLWKIIKNLKTEENGITGPEQAWYDANDRAKNDIDTAMVYEMYVDGQIAVEKEAGITLDKIKDYYMNLVKLDKATDPNYTGPNPNGSGILNPGGSITVVQKYHFKEDTGNWAQSDKMIFDIEILAQQVSAPEPVKQLSFMNNKFVSGDWHALADNKIGLLKYDSTAQTFNYNFDGVGLNPATNYCLIYYADPSGNGTGGLTGALIASGNPNGNGELILSGSKDLGDLPNINDTNYPVGGAKIWMLPCTSYNQVNHNIANWNLDTNNWLFDNWPGFIKYTKGEAPADPSGDPPPVVSQTILLNELGGDIGSQYGYQYSGYPGNVTFTYNTPASGKLTGTIAASGLKPYATYQVKFIGKPTNVTTNESIGYKGRWTCVSGSTCTGSASEKNRSDAQYVANKAKLDSDSTKEVIAGYLVWDFFTADSSGNATKAVETANSYHVLWSGGGTCNTNVNTYLASLDSAHSAVKFSPADKVDGEIERGTCGGLTLNPGAYALKMALTEESFHQGNWATVLMKDINFVIN